jgi:hypothetical protein
MKKIFSILFVSVIALMAVSCYPEDLAVFDTSKATAPVLGSYEMGDKAVSASFTPGAFNQDFNKNVQPNHFFVMTQVDGKNVSKAVTSSVKDGVLTASKNSINNTLIAMGYAEGDIVDFVLRVRASMQTNAGDNGRNGYVDSQGTIEVSGYEIVFPKGSPYQEYTETSPFSVIGSLSAYEISWDGDLEMWMTPDGNQHVAKCVTINAGDEFKFRKDQDWGVNYGGDFGSLDNAFTVSQDGPNIVAPAGLYDLWLDIAAGTATLTEAYQAYPDHKEASNWSVIGSLSEYGISWDGDLPMITDGVTHVAQGVKLTAADEFKFRQDKAWTVNLGGDYGSLGADFAVTQDGPNIKVGDGVFDLIVNPGAGTAQVVETLGGGVSGKIGGDEPTPPGPEPEPVTGWNIIGLNGDWENDVLATQDGSKWTAYITADNATEFKWRKDAGWAENYGGVMAAFGEPFAAVADGDNIKVDAGFYKVVLDTEALTITVYNDFTVWSLIGDFNSWSGDVDMVEVDGKWVAEDVQLTPGWKLRKNHDWAENRGGAFVALDEPFAVTNGGDNIDCGTGKFTVIYDPENETVTVKEGTVWSLIGDFNGWGGDVDMTLEGGLWIAEGVDLTGGWKIRKNHDWAENRGGAFVAFGEPFAVVNNGDNINCGDGKFTVTYNPAEETITVEAASYGWSVIGVNGDWNTDYDMIETAPGIWMSGPIDVTSGDWKIRYDHGWDVNRGAATPENFQVGQFLGAAPGGPNIALTGTIRVVYNANNETVGTLGWGVVGSIASIPGFNWNNDLPMNCFQDGGWASVPVYLTKDDQFKIRWQGGWDLNYGGTMVAVEEPFDAVDGGDNIKVAEDGWYVLAFDANEKKIGLTRHFWGLIGDFNEWSADVFMMYKGNYEWVAYNQTLPGGWKIREGAGWDVNRGGTFVEAGTPFDAVPGGDNINVGELSGFTVIYNQETEKITVVK